jgi:hypothetical protein
MKTFPENWCRWLRMFFGTRGRPRPIVRRFAIMGAFRLIIAQVPRVPVLHLGLLTLRPSPCSTLTYFPERISATVSSTFRCSDVRRSNAFFIRSFHSLLKECFTTLLHSQGSALFLKAAGCAPTLPILELTVCRHQARITSFLFPLVQLSIEDSRPTGTVDRRFRAARGRGLRSERGCQLSPL